MPASSTRREYLSSLAAASLAGAASLGVTSAAQAADGPVAKHGRIKQSLVNWCYAPHFPNFDEYCQTAVKLGCQSIELCGPENWPTLKKHGLTCAIAGSHGFKVGYSNPDEWAQCDKTLTERIDQCVEFGVKSVITFTGMANGRSKEEGKKNCIEGLKTITAYAEKKGVTLCLEMLNTRDDSHPMKGHPGYQGDDMDWCIDICRTIGSSHLKMLFDIYHVQIMHGDVIRRIHQSKEFLGHIHTAGNPGRGELDTRQEIYYPAVMQALLDVGYQGYVGQEFIPTRDAWEGLREAVALCDV
ncbi:MAG: hydroxypyruvate isomerase [Planctomycetota bacterium]|nr:MAG: hydroxypyruvate isomerase [Planctomycetota bacterium]